MILNAIENVHRTVYAEVFKVLNYRKYMYILCVWADVYILITVIILKDENIV